MDGCYNCCEINIVSLTYGSLQVLPWNNDSTIEKLDGCNRCCQITVFIWYITSWNQGGIIISNFDISLLLLLFCKDSKFNNTLLQFFFYNRKRVIHWMGNCNWNCELTQYLSNTCQIHCIYEIHGCKCSS